jgi:hypothetical protein
VAEAKLKGYCNSSNGEKICYGVPMLGITAERKGDLYINQGEPQEFNVNTDNPFDKYIRYDRWLNDGIDSAFRKNP